MAEEIPEVEYATGVTPSSWFGFTLSVNKTNLKAIGPFADKDFFKMFSFNLLQGNPNRVLTDRILLLYQRNLQRNYLIPLKMLLEKLSAGNC